MLYHIWHFSQWNHFYKVKNQHPVLDCRKCINLIASNVLFFSQVLSGRNIKASKYMQACTFLVVKGIFGNHRKKNQQQMIYIRDPQTPMILRNLTCYVVSMSPLWEPSHCYDRTLQMPRLYFYWVFFLLFVSNFHRLRYF